MEREQETAWACWATGQESQDKRKETQMEVLGLKPNYIPKTQKTNIHQHGLKRFNGNHLCKEKRDFGGVRLSVSASLFIDIIYHCCLEKVL